MLLKFDALDCKEHLFYTSHVILWVLFSYNKSVLCHAQREYYSCDAFYRNWLKIDLENAEVASHVISSEEKQRAVSAARETLDSSLQLLQSELPLLYGEVYFRYIRD